MSDRTLGHKPTNPSVQPHRKRLAGSFLALRMSVAMFTATPETAQAVVTTADVVTAAASEVGSGEDVLAIENEVTPGGIKAVTGNDPWEPERPDLEQYVDVALDEREKHQEEIEREAEAASVQEAKNRDRGAEISGPAPPNDPYWRANVARAERLGEAIDAKWGPEGELYEAEQRMARAEASEERVDRDSLATDADRLAARMETAAAQADLVSVQTEVDMAPEHRLERANAQLESAEDTERGVVLDQRSTESERLAARFATVDAQVGQLNAQSARDAADLNHRAVLHQGVLAEEWVRERGVRSGPDIFREPAVRDLIQQQSVDLTNPGGTALGRKQGDLAATAPGPEALGEAAERIREVEQRAIRIGEEGVGKVEARTEAELDERLGAVNKTLHEARSEVNQVSYEAARQVAADRQAVLDGLRADVERVNERTELDARMHLDTRERGAAEIDALRARADDWVSAIDQEMDQVRAARVDALESIDRAALETSVAVEQARESLSAEGRTAPDATEQLRPVVIGEDQPRVNYAAERFDAETYPGLSPDEARRAEGSAELDAARLAHNEAWLRKSMDEGRIVIDAGPAEPRTDYPQPTHGAHGAPTDAERTYPESAPYEMERRVSEGYERKISPWEDMSRSPWVDEQGQLNVRTLDDQTRAQLRERDIDPDTVREGPWRFSVPAQAPPEPDTQPDAAARARALQEEMARTKAQHTPEPARQPEPAATTPEPSAGQDPARTRALQEELARVKAADQAAAREAADKAAKEATDKAAKEATDKAAKEQHEKAAQEAADKAAQEAADKAAKEQHEKPEASPKRNGRGANQREATQRDTRQRHSNAAQGKQQGKEAQAPARKQK